MPFQRTPGRKYGNRKVKADGHTFDSVVERDRYLQLKGREAAGEISHLEVKPKFPIEVNGVEICRPFRPDFRYFARSIEFGQLCEREVVEDVKGYLDPKDQATRIFHMKCRLVKALYGVEIEVVQTPEAVRRQERRQASNREKARLQRLAKKKGAA